MIDKKPRDISENSLLDKIPLTKGIQSLLKNIDLTTIAGNNAQLTDENINHIAKCFAKIDSELTASPQWRSYWDLYQISHSQNDQSELDALKKQFLKKYKDKIIQACVFVPRNNNESESEHILNQIPFQDILQTYNQYLTNYPIPLAKEQLKIDCENYLTYEVKKELTKTEQLLSKALLVSPILQLRKALLRFKLTLAYQLLGKESADKITIAIENKKKDLLNVTSSVDDVIRAICRQALPGVNISKFISQETKKLIPLIQKVPGLWATSMIAHLLRRYEVMKMIHDTTIDTQALHCKSFYKDNGDFTEIQNELSKITEYRVKRNVIEKIFDYFLEDIHGKKSASHQDKFLIFLQNTYLNAISNQLKNISPEQRISFIDKMKNKKILSFCDNKSLQAAFASMIAQAQNAPFNRNQEETQLHEAGSPVEMNILLGLAKELTMCVISSTDAIEAEQIIFNYLKQTFQDIQAPDFIPRPYIEELALDRSLFQTLRERLLYLQSMTLRRKFIDSVYHLALDYDTKLHPKKLWRKKSNFVMDLSEYLLPIYIEALKNDIHDFTIQNPRDRYIIYCLYLSPALKAPYFLEAAKQPKIKHYYDELLNLTKMVVSEKSEPKENFQ